MTEQHHTTDPTAPERVPPAPGVVVERTVERVPVRSGWVRPFIAGFLTAVVAAAVTLGVFLVVSDSDDDGTIDLEVPAVQVDE